MRNNIVKNDHYNFTLGYRARQTVYKWWCVIYKPVYKLCHHGNWPEEKEPFYKLNNAATIPPEEQEERNKLAEQISQGLIGQNQTAVDDILSSIEQPATAKPTPTTSGIPDTPVQEAPEAQVNDSPAASVDDDVLARANEIMERLAREAAEDEAKKQKEIEDAKRVAEEQAKLASIMDKNKVDISLFIEEGKKNQNHV